MKDLLPLIEKEYEMNLERLLKYRKLILSGEARLFLEVRIVKCEAELDHIRYRIEKESNKTKNGRTIRG